MVNLDTGLYSLRHLNLSHQLFSPSTAAAEAATARSQAAVQANAERQAGYKHGLRFLNATATSLDPLPAASINFKPCGPSNLGDTPLDLVALLGDESKIICADLAGRTSLYDAEAHAVVTVPDLRSPKGRDAIPISITRAAVDGDPDQGDSIYVMSRTPDPNRIEDCFEELRYGAGRDVFSRINCSAAGVLSHLHHSSATHPTSFLTHATTTTSIAWLRCFVPRSPEIEWCVSESGEESESAPRPALGATAAPAATPTAAATTANPTTTMPPSPPCADLSHPSPIRIPSPRLATPPPSPSGHLTSPESSPEKLDWGSIEDEDGAYGPCSSQLEQGPAALEGDRSASPVGTTSAVLKGKAAAHAQLPSAFNAALAFNAPDTYEHGACSKAAEDTAAFPPPLSPAGHLHSVAGPNEVPAKLKSILVRPSPRQQSSAPVKQDSREWQRVKPKHWWRKRAFPSSSPELRRSHGAPMAPPRPAAYKEIFQGRCFRCLAKDHRLVHCREPPRCISCLGSGHFVRHCPQAKKAGERLPVHSRLLFPKPSVKTRLTFPPNSIHSRITFPPLHPSTPPPTSSPAQVLPGGTTEEMARPLDRYVPGFPDGRRAHGTAAVVAGPCMTAELQKLRHQTIVVTARDNRYRANSEQMQFALNQQLRIPLHNITVSRHKSQRFLARFDYPEQRDIALRAGSVEIGGTKYKLEPWREEDCYNRPAGWYYRALIYIENLPLYAWSAEGVKQVLDDVCVFNRMASPTFSQEAIDAFGFWGWMGNPNHLPCTKTSTFITNVPARSRSSSGGSGNSAAFPAPPSGGVAELIIHLARYEDWTPRSSPSPSSDISGLSSSSSTRCDSRPFPFVQRFDWDMGVVDGRAAPAPRLLTACRDPPALERRDHGHDDDDIRDPPRRAWQSNMSARGRPADDYTRGSSHGYRHRTRSPRSHERRHGDHDDDYDRVGSCQDHLLVTVLAYHSVVTMRAGSAVDPRPRLTGARQAVVSMLAHHPRNLLSWVLGITGPPPSLQWTGWSQLPRLPRHPKSTPTPFWISLQA
ncbi:hypothetical protein EJB05_57294, partial [Eragrostis curvula]